MDVGSACRSPSPQTRPPVGWAQACIASCIDVSHSAPELYQRHSSYQLLIEIQESVLTITRSTQSTANGSQVDQYPHRSTTHAKPSAPPSSTMTTTATAQPGPGPGPLSSDHINYLILRYLQEAGHEASATAFYRDWRRPAEYRDPEDLPFAPAVQRHELVSVIQDGLHHDELVSRVRKEGRRFSFTTNGAGSGSRPGTAGGKGKGRLDQIRRGTDEFPTPPSKRQRKSDESPRERQVNGAPAAAATEPMDVDAASPSAGDAEEDAEAASPAVQSPEPEIIEVPERYDSMDVAVQTEGKSGPKTSTMYWRIEGKADATILHNQFSPARGSRVLFTAGEGVSRFYEVPGDLEGGVEKIASLEDVGVGAGGVVTACAWHPLGHAMAFAVDQVRDIGIGGKLERRQVIKCHDAKSAKTREFRSPPLLEPAGIVMALRYNWAGSQLLAIRTNGSRGTVEIWDTQLEEGNGYEHGSGIRAWSIFEDRVLDAAWISPSKFVVCGDGGLLQKLRLNIDQSNGLKSEPEHNSESARTHGLEALPTPSLSNVWQHLSLDKIRVPVPIDGSAEDSKLSFVAVASEENTLIQALTNSDSTREIATSGHDERITALAFQPHHVPSDHTQAVQNDSILAIAREDGHITLHHIHHDLPAQLEATFHLADRSPALALAWSPGGTYLAVAGTDVVQIWETKPLIPTSTDDSRSVRASEPLVTWRRDKSRRRNGEHAANGATDEPLEEPSLSWTADGEGLAVGVGKEVCAFPPCCAKTKGSW